MSTESQRRALETVEQSGRDPWTVASAVSVVLALFVYFVNKDREMGIFIGLWAPTILAFANYFKQQRMYEAMNRLLEREGVIDRVEKIVQGR